MKESIEMTRHGKIVEVALNRPEAYNALNLEMTTTFAEHMTKLARDDSVRGIVLVGKGKAFCAGGDLKWAVQFPDGPGVGFHILAAQLHLAIIEIRRMKKPVVAAINGIAAGGGFSLALACDFRVMGKSVILKQAYTSSGLCIDGGGTFTLPRLVGLARAMEIAAYDQPISSDQALDWGLVTKVVEDDKVLTEAISMLDELTKRSLQSFACVKKLLTDSFHHSFESQLERERVGLVDCTNHGDGQEGLNAFIEKRNPRFDV